ncbi:MAG TPA: HepT-like ribonuclease domain-containing protein [Terriglobales bacterium]|nr:HepT-like ribonuclease domain-containing protein [Terriglobales bacterium]
MTERDRVHLEYIRESIERIAEYTDGGTEDRFRRHALVQDAVLRRLETLADASHKLPEA